MREAKLEDECDFKIRGKNFSHMYYADGTTLLAENANDLQTFIMKIMKSMKSVIKSKHKEGKTNDNR